LGHKVSDGKSIVVTSPVGGTVKDNPYEVGGVFGFADDDTLVGEQVSLSIGQEEREVTLPASAGGWLVGERVFWTGTAFTDVQTSNRLVGIVTRVVAAGGGVGWMVVAANAFLAVDEA